MYMYMTPSKLIPAALTCGLTAARAFLEYEMYALGVNLCSTKQLNWEKSLI